MKKSEFKKMLKKENKAFKNFYLYGVIIIFLFLAIIITNVLLNLNELIPLNVFWINAALAFAVAIPFVVIDVKNDKEINVMYNAYQKDGKIPEYKDKTKALKIILILSIIVVIIDGLIMAKFTLMNKEEEPINTSLEITTEYGNTITTQYEDIGEFSIKIPTEFNIMSDEAISVKYPNGNAPSLVYTNERGTINVAFALNDVAMKESEIEEYTKIMEETYKQYTDDINVNFFERNNHTVGEIKFVTPASDTNIYNHIIAFSVDGKLRLVTFNCTEELRDEWEEVGDFIIKSLVFNDKTH